ncbi:hypothetical protein [Anaerosolibacter sp.]|uniref:hypothetical protein n=1 Tax=Anaerosolibacter sp. TaxID=1872527 RepID=UPI0039EED181
MKKIFVMLLVGIMVFASVGSAFAVEPANDQMKTEQRKAMREERKTDRLEMLKALQDEIHQINELRMERLDVRGEIIGKHDLLLDLYITAKENGNDAALMAAKEVRVQLKGLNDELQALHEQIKTTRQLLKEAKQNGETDQVELLAGEIISLGNEMNNKLEDKVGLLDEIIDILS